MSIIPSRHVVEPQDRKSSSLNGPREGVKRTKLKLSDELSKTSILWVGPNRQGCSSDERCESIAIKVPLRGGTISGGTIKSIGPSCPQWLTRLGS